MESEIVQTTRAIVEVGAQIDRLSRQYLATTSESERRKIGDDQNAAEELFENLKEERERSKERLEPVLNDYIISGCDNVLGPL
ncbi:MAG: hypothetical protein ACR2OV_16570 [Hyphomicrobiaceae bacterium]